MDDHPRGEPGLEPDGRSLVKTNGPSELAVPARGYPPAGYAQAPTADGEGDLAQDLLYYLRIVLKRKWLIASVALLALTLGTLYTLMQTPLYSASARVQIDQQGLQVVENQNLGVGVSDLRTEILLLRSRALAERVVSTLQLDAEPGFGAPRTVSLKQRVKAFVGGDDGERSIPSPIARRARATSVVLGNVSIQPVRGSKLVDIVYTDPSPDRAQRIANAYAEAFVASKMDKRFQANAFAKTFLEDQLAQLKIRLQQAQDKLVAAAEEEQIVEIGSKSSIVEANYAAANEELNKITAERIKQEQLLRQVEADANVNLPQLQASGTITELRKKRNELVQEYQEKLGTFKPRYPEMVKLNKQIAELDRQINEEAQTMRGTLRASYESLKNQEQEMLKRVTDLRAQVLDLQKRSIRHDILQREVETTRSMYNNLLNRLKQVDVASGVSSNNVFIVDRARKPGSPSQPNMRINLAMALVLGLGLGFGGAFLLEILDDRVRIPEELEEVTGLSTLGIIPALPSAEDFELQMSDPRSGISEAYRSMATALQFSTEAGLPRTIYLTSAGPSEGKSSSSIAIARHFATMGMKVLLIDADLRKPSLHAKLGYDNSIGLSNYLTGAMTPPETFQDTDTPNLTLMASGPLPPNAADLLGGTRIYSLLSVGLEVFDLIVIDGPPLLGLADAQLLSSAASATVFVVGAGQQRKGPIRNALRRLSMSRARVVGAVLTKFDAKATGYGYGYGYGYSYAYSTAYGADPYKYGVQGDTDAQNNRPALAKQPEA